LDRLHPWVEKWHLENGDHLPEDYYAWEWGDALFVAIDPFWYTTTKPFIGNIGGGESSDVGPATDGIGLWDGTSTSGLSRRFKTVKPHTSLSLLIM
jgi:hypothetical protein